GDGDDIVFGGDDGERVVNDVWLSPGNVTRRIEAAVNVKGVEGDIIDAGQGDNIVFGDNGAITAAASNLSRFGGQPITLGLVETVESLIGGSDTITTGVGRDIILGGIDADVIVANFDEYQVDAVSGVLHGADANNIVIGD